MSSRYEERDREQYDREGYRGRRPIRYDLGPNYGEFRDYEREGYLYGTGGNYGNREYDYGPSFAGSEYGPEYGGDYRGRNRYDRGYRYRGYEGDATRRFSYGGGRPDREYGAYGSQIGYGHGFDRDRYGRGFEYGRGQEERSWWDRAADEVSSWFGDEHAERRRRLDRLHAHHRGRGPKGYRRSDARITEDVNDRLSDDYYLDASEVSVAVSEGEVTLSGTVNNRWDKRRAEDLAESVSGVNNVENRLRVAAHEENFATADTAPGMSRAAGAGSNVGAENRTKGMN